MQFYILPFVLVLLYARCTPAAQTYSRSLDIVGPAFYDEFVFFTGQDPTHGRVSYVDQRTARQHNITYATDNSFVLRADDTSYLRPSDPGRISARIVSRRQFGSFVAVFDMLHMPEGCGTWPAVWTVGSDWPNKGEIDVVEGVNRMNRNIASLHTGSNCHMPAQRDMTGQSIGTNCAAYETGNNGCGVQFYDGRSFGSSFNANRGGWYALRRTNDKIEIWFWSRYDDSVPWQIKFGSSVGVIEPDQWGKPAAIWTNEMCDFPAHFGPHSIVINLTFCGDWAGAVYGSSGCPDTCESFVNNNPGSFYDAYFEFVAIRIYI